jgi:hypothetical protein
MGWERRQRGGVYFYRTARINGQPRKLYVGTGQAAETYAHLEAERRHRQQAERYALEAELMKVSGADRALEDLLAVTALLVRATLLTLGLHEHRSEWRRRRT